MTIALLNWKGLHADGKFSPRKVRIFGEVGVTDRCKLST